MKLKNYLQDWQEFLEKKTDGKSLGADNERGEIYQNLVQGHYQGALEKMYPRLSDFSDLNWEAVSQEYFSLYPPTSFDLNQLTFDFPQYLQSKAQDGDCPLYLFELAYYELAEFQVYTSPVKPPTTKGIHLNPTATYLSFEFDIPRMVREAEAGDIKVYERPHVLCISRHSDGLLRFTELDQKSLDILLQLEDGPLKDHDQKVSDTFRKLVEQGVIVVC